MYIKWGPLGKSQRKYPTIPDNMIYGENAANDSKRLANLFAEYFGRVFSNATNVPAYTNIDSGFLISIRANNSSEIKKKFHSNTLRLLISGRIQDMKDFQGFLYTALCPLCRPLR